MPPLGVKKNHSVCVKCKTWSDPWSNCCSYAPAHWIHRPAPTKTGWLILIERDCKLAAHLGAQLETPPPSFRVLFVFCSAAARAPRTPARAEHGEARQPQHRQHGRKANAQQPGSSRAIQMKLETSRLVSRCKFVTW